MEQSMDSIVVEATSEEREPKTFEERLLDKLDLSNFYLERIENKMFDINTSVGELKYRLERIEKEVSALQGGSYPKANLADIKKELDEIKGGYSAKSLKDIYDRVNDLYYKR